MTLVCGPNDWEPFEDRARDNPGKQRLFSFRRGRPRAQTCREAFRLIPPSRASGAMRPGAASLHMAQQTGRGASPEVIAIDGEICMDRKRRSFQRFCSRPCAPFGATHAPIGVLNATETRTASGPDKTISPQDGPLSAKQPLFF